VGLEPRSSSSGFIFIPKGMFHCKWYIAEKTVLRIYSKELTNGKKKVRIEIQQSPQLDIETLQMNILKKIVE
jgi:hypothetical protein